MKHLILLSALLFCLNGFAIKDVSGGNGVGGTLQDLTAYDSSTILAGEELQNIFVSELGPTLSFFPTLRWLALHVFTMRKLWFLEDREFNPNCKNQSIVSLPQEIWACQNEVEVRINRVWWNSATGKQKAWLLLHEVLTSLRFSDRIFSAVIPATAAFADKNLTPEQIQERLLILGFSYFPTENELAFLGNELMNFGGRLCTATTQFQADILAIDATLSLLENKTTHPKLAQIFDDAAQEYKKYYGSSCSLVLNNPRYYIIRSWLEKTR